MSNFHVGQKVVCVNAERTSWRRKKFLGLINYTVWWSELIEGEIYEVKEVFHGTDILSGEEGVGLKLAGMNNYANSGFNAHRFRPLVERKTDISLFKAMLNKPTVRIDA
jgi:hypothetical protein